MLTTKVDPRAVRVKPKKSAMANNHDDTNASLEAMIAFHFSEKKFFLKSYQIIYFIYKPSLEIGKNNIQKNYTYHNT